MITATDIRNYSPGLIYNRSLILKLEKYGENKIMDSVKQQIVQIPLSL